MLGKNCLLWNYDYITLLYNFVDCKLLSNDKVELALISFKCAKHARK